MARPRKIKSELAARLIQARGGIAIEEIVASCDVAASTYAGYERGDTTPDAEFIGKFILRTGADPWALLTGSSPAANDDGARQSSGELVLVDRLDLQVSAGAGTSSASVPVAPVSFSLQSLRRHSLKAADLAVLEVRGDSMEPVLADGDAILVDKARSRPVSGKMYVVVRGDDVQVKWVLPTKPGATLVSENDAYPPERVDPHEAPDFYRVRWLGHFLD